MRDPGQIERSDGAEALGARVAMSFAIAVGLVLAFFARESWQLVASVLGITVVVTAFARVLGRRAGRLIVGKDLIRGLGVGVVGGLAALCATAVCAAVVGALWGLAHHELVDQAWAYLGKPFVGTFYYGSVFALPIGAIAGAAIHFLAASRE